MNQRKYNDAIHQFKHVLELDSNFFFAWDNIGWVNYKMGNIDKALEAVDNAIGSEPNYANGWYNKSIYIIKKANIDEAITYLKRAIELDPNYIEQAKTETDFKDIRNDKRFIRLIDRT